MGGRGLVFTRKVLRYGSQFPCCLYIVLNHSAIELGDTPYLSITGDYSVTTPSGELPRVNRQIESTLL